MTDELVARFLPVTSGHTGARWYGQHADTCHPSNGEYMLSRRDDARAGNGQTLLDILVEVIRDHGPGGSQADDGVVLESRNCDKR